MTKLYRELKDKNEEDAINILKNVSNIDLMREFKELVDFKVGVATVAAASSLPVTTNEVFEFPEGEEPEYTAIKITTTGNIDQPKKKAVKKKATKKTAKKKK